MLGKVLTALALLFGIGLLGALGLAATHHTWQARQARRGLPNSSGVATSALSRKGNPTRGARSSGAACTLDAVTIEPSEAQQRNAWAHGGRHWVRR